MFEYIIYGKNVKSNVALKYAIENNTKGVIRPIIYLDASININYVNNLYYGIKSEKNKVTIGYQQISYQIDVKLKLIRVETCHIDWLERTFYNLPLSIYCLMNNEIVLHCSAILFNNNIYAFVGNKKTGKSTLAMKLFVYQNMEIVSDDSLLINGNKTYIPHNICKLSKEIIDTMDDQVFDFKKFDDEIDKYWIKLKGDRFFCNNALTTIFLLKRSDKKEYIKREIKNIYEKKIIILNNIVGIKNMPGELKRRLVMQHFNIFEQNIKIYELTVPEEKFNESKIGNLFI